MWIYYINFQLLPQTFKGFNSSPLNVPFVPAACVNHCTYARHAGKVSTVFRNIRVNLSSIENRSHHQTKYLLRYN